jgi:hypothetical protein
VLNTAAQYENSLAQIAKKYGVDFDNIPELPAEVPSQSIDLYSYCFNEYNKKISEALSSSDGSDDFEESDDCVSLAEDAEEDEAEEDVSSEEEENDEDNSSDSDDSMMTAD